MTSPQKRKLYYQQYRERHRKQARRYSKIYYKKNKQRIAQRTKNFRKIHSKKLNKRSRVWRESHQAYCRQYTRQDQKRRKRSDPLFKLAAVLRTRVYLALQNMSFTKTSTLNTFLGCTLVKLKVHLEKQFQEGMSWSNHGKWHIDHIIPLASAKNKRELYKLCHYTNLQPLWAKKNLIKGKQVI